MGPREVPASPKSLNPHPHTCGSAPRRELLNVWVEPAAALRTVTPGTSVGARLHLMLPGSGASTHGLGSVVKMRWDPHSASVPSMPQNRLCHAPASTPPCAPASIMTGVGRDVSVPSPSCPKELSPQAQSVPSFPTARLKYVPARTIRIPLKPGIWAATSVGASWHAVRPNVKVIKEARYAPVRSIIL